MLEYENQVLLGDCLEVLKELPADTFDANVMDSPYGLGKEPTPAEILAYLNGADLKTGDFMGKDWDIPSVPVWREIYRVLKPGAHVFAFGGTRTSDLISLGARAAGFEKRDTIADIFPALMWIQGQGMPKTTNISKSIDKKKGAQRKVLGPDEARRKRANKGTTSEILPSYAKPRAAQAEAVVTEPATPEAQQWEGYGTGLKPTWEPILVFRKPFKGTLTDNVLENGTGALNIDGCRVKHASVEDFEKHKAGVDALKAKGGSMQNSWKNSSDLAGANDVTSAGRWPPNIVMVHAPGCQRFEPTESNPAEAYICVSGCPVRELDIQSGDRPATLTGRADPNQAHDNPGDNHGKSTFGGGNSRVYADAGGASRYYPQFPTAPFSYTAKPSKKETSLDGAIKNNHPTKKPLRLMRWLVRLATPAPIFACPTSCVGETISRAKPGVCPSCDAPLKRVGGLVLDPYCGSGSTLHAAHAEGLRYTGIERDPEAHAVASKRMEIVEGRARDLKSQRDLFQAVMSGEFDG